MQEVIMIFWWIEQLIKENDLIAKWIKGENSIYSLQTSWLPTFNTISRKKMEHNFDNKIFPKARISFG